MHLKILTNLNTKNQKFIDQNNTLHIEIKYSKEKDCKLEKKFTNLKSFYDKLCDNQRAMSMILRSWNISMKKKGLGFKYQYIKPSIKIENRPKKYYTQIPKGSIIKPKVMCP